MTRLFSYAMRTEFIRWYDGDLASAYDKLEVMAVAANRAPLAYEALIGSGLTPLEAAKILVADD